METRGAGFPSRTRVPSFPARTGNTNHHRPSNDSRESKERNVGLGLVPSQNHVDSRPANPAIHALVIPHSFPDLVIPAIKCAYPVPRYGAGIQGRPEWRKLSYSHAPWWPAPT